MELLIVGASARAAAQSAARCAAAAGIRRVVAADLFGDRDLRHVATWIRLNPEDPAAVDRLARQAATCGAWLYTGAMENHPRLLERLAAAAPLAGTPPEALARLRNPFLLRSALRAEGLAERTAPAYRAAPFPSQKTWLRKRYRSAGGIGIEPVPRSGRAGSPSPGPQRYAGRTYYQPLLPGSPVSALFLSGPEPDRARLLGVTEQLVGTEWGAPGPFRHAGNIWVGTAPAPERSAWQALGDAIARLGARGIFGIDAVRTGQQIRLLEVNPRWTASAELWERVSGCSAVGMHLACCGGQDTRNGSLLHVDDRAPLRGHWGKLTVFAPQDIHWRPDQLPPLLEWLQQQTAADRLEAADLPVAACRIDQGQPLLTLLVRESSDREARRRMAQLVEILYSNVTTPSIWRKRS